MADKLIKQHKNMAMGKAEPQGAVEDSFKMGINHGKPARGQLGDTQRGVGRPVTHTRGMLPAQRHPDHGYSD